MVFVCLCVMGSGDAVSGRKQLYSFIAGGLAGSFAATITCPLEVIKTRLQSSAGQSAVREILSGASKDVAMKSVWDRHTVLIVMKQIATVEGPSGFFRGILPTVLGIFPTRATYFWAYSTCKGYFQPIIGDNAGLHLLSAASAGIGSAIATNPVWMIKTRYQLAAGTANAYQSYGAVVSTIWQQDGIRGFYRGLTASIFGVSETAIQFLIYERVKREMLERKQLNNPEAELGGLQVFGAAAGAKLCASLLTYPHEVVRTRLRELVSDGSKPKYTGVPQALKLIFAEEGVRGLYAGIEAHMLRTVPNAAFMFMAYEAVVKFLSKTDERMQKQRQSNIRGNLC